MANQTSTLIIEELTGQKRRVELHGPGLPLQGAAWAGKMRMVTRSYTGNSAEATQQVLGPALLPSQWNGIWRTTQLLASPCFYAENGGSPQPIVRASSLRDVMETIFESGQRLRVTWVAGSVDDPKRIVRIGRASEWSFPHDRPDDINWNVTFEWVSKGQAVQQVVSLRGEDKEAARRDAQVKLNDALTKATSDQAVASQKARDKNLPATAISLGDLEAFAAGPSKMLDSFIRAGRQVVNRLQRLGELGVKLESMPASLEAQLLDAATDTIAIANQFADSSSRTPVEVLSNRNKVSNLLQASRYFGATEKNIEDATDSALTLRSVMRSRNSNQIDGATKRKDSAGVADVLGTWIARQGDTYAAISSRFFGTPEHGYAIAKANARTTKTQAYAIAPTPGVVLVIPNLTAIKNIEDV